MDRSILSLSDRISLSPKAKAQLWKAPCLPSESLQSSWGHRACKLKITISGFKGNFVGAEAAQKQRTRVQSGDGMARSRGKSLCSWFLLAHAAVSQLHDLLYEIMAAIKSRIKWDTELLPASASPTQLIPCRELIHPPFPREDCWVFPDCCLRGKKAHMCGLLIQR